MLWCQPESHLSNFSNLCMYIHMNLSYVPCSKGALLNFFLLSKWLSLAIQQLGSDRWLKKLKTVDSIMDYFYFFLAVSHMPAAARQEVPASPSHSWTQRRWARLWDSPEHCFPGSQLEERKDEFRRELEMASPRGGTLPSLSMSCGPQDRGSATFSCKGI